MPARKLAHRDSRVSPQTWLLQHQAEETTRQTRALRDEIKANLDIISTLRIHLENLSEIRKEMKELRYALTRTTNTTTRAMQFMLRLLDDPDAKDHANAMMRDYFYTRPERKKE